MAPTAMTAAAMAAAMTTAAVTTATSPRVAAHLVDDRLLERLRRARCPS
jgi:hypothetical protein